MKYLNEFSILQEIEEQHVSRGNSSVGLPGNLLDTIELHVELPHEDGETDNGIEETFDVSIYTTRWQNIP